MSKFAQQYGVHEGEHIVSTPITIDTSDLVCDKFLTLEQVIDNGQDVHNFVMAELARLDSTELADRRAVLKKAQNEFPDFQRDYSIVIRWSVFEEEYSPKALEHYIKHHFKPTWKNKREFAEAQVEYVVALHRFKDKKLAGKRLQKLRSDLVRTVLKEEKEFDKAAETAKAECKRLEAQDKQRLRHRLIKFIQQQQADGKLFSVPAGGAEGYIYTE